jgi:hypothetical protein
MKTFIAKILIVCVFAISFHGFAPDEHLLPGIEHESATQISLHNPDGTGDVETPSMQASCDICQVVHQYILTENVKITDRGFVIERVSQLVRMPPDQSGEDILHPPTV